MSEGVKVDRKIFREALLHFRKLYKPKKNDQIFLSTDDGKLKLFARQVEITVDAEGELGCIASVNADFFSRLHSVLPKEDPLPIVVINDTLMIGSFKIACSIEDTPATPVRTPKPHQAMYRRK